MVEWTRVSLTGAFGDKRSGTFKLRWAWLASYVLGAGLAGAGVLWLDGMPEGRNGTDGGRISCIFILIMMVIVVGSLGREWVRGGTAGEVK